MLSQWSEDASSEVMAQVAEHPATSCNSWMSLTNWFLGRSDDSLRRAENAVRLGERHRYALAVATQQRAMLHQLRNEPDECCEWAEHTLALERPFLSKFRRLQAEVLRGWALAKADRNGRASGPDAAGASMEAAIGGFREAGVRLDAPYYLALYGDVLIESGRPAEALGVLEEAQDLIDARTRAYFHRSEILRLRGQAIRLLGQPDSGDRARAELDDSLTLAQAMGSPALALRTLCDRFELETEAGDPERWREPLSRLVDRYDGQAPTPDVLRAQALLGS